MTIAPGIHEMERDLSWAELVMGVFIHVHDGIIITDRQGQIVEVNNAFCTITGYSRDEVLGRNPRFLQSGTHDANFYAALWRALLANGVWRGEITNRRKDGRSVVELLTISAVHGSDGRTISYIGIFTDIMPLKVQQRELERLAYFDALTGLPNRRMLMDRLRQMLAWAERSARSVAVCYMDIDGFKAINDVQGHHTGDRVLVEVARRLEKALRKGDTVARLGGDEFALLLATPNTVVNVNGVLERILASVQQPIGDACTAVISASIGMTVFPTDHADAETLLRHADQAMYRAKNAGPGRYCQYEAGIMTAPASPNRLPVP
ncbi:sensor domain-containing diguanylate cyclase [Azonexus sp.]|uniref:sensor domain-containing diguanylate cyclase n=1 Tax=Azonexus sp. TaxID=1872668 RepID=UPI002838ECB8|nr:sensor domain-containing diguanylate cyclase [Azonexus sp.]MDR1994195.1 sensor domain-containing diguanylate cyclase [Azonexus sp.]